MKAIKSITDKLIQISRFLSCKRFTMLCLKTFYHIVVTPTLIHLK